MERLVGKDGPVMLASARLVARRRGVADRLSKAIHLASTGGPTLFSDPGARIRLDDAGGALWIATIWPLTSATAAGLQAGHAGALLALTDLTRARQVEPQLLQELLGLSPAEARLVAALAAGESLNDIVARTGVTQNTVRSQIKSVFSKLDVSSQVELIRILDVLARPA
jgi:DNA-binding CsgD family transcriptional regulator